MSNYADQTKRQYSPPLEVDVTFPTNEIGEWQRTDWAFDLGTRSVCHCYAWPIGAPHKPVLVEVMRGHDEPVMGGEPHWHNDSLILYANGRPLWAVELYDTLSEAMDEVSFKALYELRGEPHPRPIY